MSASKAIIKARMELDDNQFQKQADNVSRRSKRLGTQMETTAKKVGNAWRGVGKAILGAVAVAAILRQMRTAREEADRLVKASDKLGVSFEFIQKLTIATEKAGLAANTGSMALQRFARRMAEARAGTGEALKAVNELGIRFRNLDGSLKTTEELFRDVANELARVPEQSDKLRLAFKFFDSEGVGILNAIKGGYQDIEEAARGVALMTEESARRMEDLNNKALAFQKNVSSALVRAQAALFDFGETLQDAFGDKAAREGLKVMVGEYFDAGKQLEGIMAGIQTGLPESPLSPMVEDAKDLNKQLQTALLLRRRLLPGRSALEIGLGMNRGAPVPAVPTAAPHARDVQQDMLQKQIEEATKANQQLAQIQENTATGPIGK